MRKSLIRPIVNPFRLQPQGGGYRANSAHPMNFGLLFSWIFCEGAGPVVYDMSPNGIDGAITLNGSMADMWRTVSCARNDALRAPIGTRGLAVNGTVGQYVTLPRLTVGDFTLISDHASLWSSASYPTDWGWSSASYAQALIFYPLHAGKSSHTYITAIIAGGADKSVTLSTAATLTERNVWAITRVSATGNVQFFKNGVSLGAAAASGTGAWAMPAGRIGMDGLNTNSSLPQMFRFEMYNRVLSSTELAWHNLYAYPYGTYNNPRFVQVTEEENYFNSAGAFLLNPDLKGGMKDLYGGF